MLLQKQETQVTLQTPAQKILKFSDALNKTYVYITTCKSPQNTEKLVHIDERGKVLWEKNYKQSIDTFAMFNDRDVIVLNVSEGTIEIIDLSTHKIRSESHAFTFQDTSYMQLITFYDTRFLCVKEQGNIGDGKLILTYYRYSSNQFEKVCEYKSKQGQWVYGQNTAKANNHSKIVWWKNIYTDQIDFTSFDLKASNQGTVKTIKCRNTLSTLYRLQNITVCVGSLWQSAPEIYMLACNTNTVGQTLGAFRKTVVIDSISGIIRQSRFCFEKIGKSQFSVVDFLNLGAYSVFFTQKMTQGKAQDSLIYYVDNESEKVITTQTWKATNLVHYFAPGSDPNLVLFAEHQNSNVKEVKFTSKRLMTISEMYLHFLLHLNEDFDDDLLQDSLEIIGVI